MVGDVGRERGKSGEWLELVSALLVSKGGLGLYLAVVFLAFCSLSAQSPELDAPHFKQGSQYLSQGKTQEARESLLKAVELNEPVPELYTLLGQILERTKEVDLAIEVLSRGAERFPRLPEIYSELGHFHLLKGAFQEGIKAYERAAVLSGQSRDDVLNLATAYYRKGLSDLRGERYFDSLISAKKANQLVPDTAEFVHLLGSSYLALGQKLDAKKEFERAIELDPDNANYIYDLALTHLRLNDSGKAEELLKKTVSLNPDFPMPYIFLGRIYHNSKRTDEALESFKNARDIDPELKGVHYHIGFAFKAKGEDQKAIEEMETEVARHPDYLPARIELGDLYLRIGDGKSAARHLNYAIQLDASQARAHFLLGKALFEQADLERSLKAFSEASRLDPSMAQAHYWKAQIHMKQGNRGLAQTEITLFEEKKKGQPDF